MIGLALGAFGLAALVLPARSIATPATRPVRRPSSAERRRGIALALDLLAGALRIGLPADAALSAVSRALAAAGAGYLRTASEPLARVARLIQLGADPAAAWGTLAAESDFARVAAAGQRCADSGARLADALVIAAAELRAERHALGMACAQRVGVWSLLPLGLCFLPAFVCIGIVPVVGGLADQFQSSY